jgi:hypothetical protein
MRRFEFRTRNTRESENKAHSREEARARGFGGSIVGGATVYGQSIQPLLEELGEAWLGSSRVTVRFKSPAYDDDVLEARIEEESVGDLAAGEKAHGPGYRVRTYNEAGVELLDIRTHVVVEAPPLDPRSALQPIEWDGERREGNFERFELERPFRTYEWSLSRDEQLDYCAATGDDLPLYRRGATPPAHPGLVMSQGSFVVSNQFRMPFWIHASSSLLQRRVIRVGDRVELRCVPYEKWKRGGSEWVKFYQLYLLGGEPAIEVWKTSVIKVAPRQRA